MIRSIVLVAAGMLIGCANAPPPASPQLPAAATTPLGRWLTIGDSVEGRPIEMQQFGEGPLRVLVIGSIHGDETEGLAVLDDVVRSLDSPEVNALATVRVLRDVNPDGTASRSRTNTRGVDLNRNWPASNYEPGGTRGPAALSEPETRAAHAAYLAFGPNLVVVFHSTARGPFVNHDPHDADHAARVFAGAAAANDSRWRVVADMGYATPGSLGTFSGIDRRVPTLTIEFDRGHDPAQAFAVATAGIRAATRELSPAAR